MRARWLCLAVIVSACGSDRQGAEGETGETGITHADAGSDTSATATDGDGETSAPTTGDPGEACFSIRYPAVLETLAPPWQLGCGAPTLCAGDGVMTFILTGDVLAPTTVETDELERARCMATALAERRPGQFDFIPVLDIEVQAVLSIEIVGDHGVARTEPGSCSLLPRCDSYESLRALREPEFFLDCVDGDAPVLWACLINAFETDPSCLPGPLECP